MLRARRSNLSRVLTVLLAVVMVAFPAAASAGPAGHCCAGEVDAADACCQTSHAEDAQSAPQDNEPSQPAGCGKCMHACCRTAADVARVRVSVVTDEEVVAPVLFPPESSHDPVTCDAIFHPPRA